MDSWLHPMSELIRCLPEVILQSQLILFGVKQMDVRHRERW